MSLGSPTRILIVDDNAIVRESIKRFLDDEDGISVCGEAESPDEAMLAIRDTSFDLVLLDLSMELGDGLELAMTLRSAYPALPILILSLYSEVVFAEQAIRAGANGYIMKSDAAENLVEAIHTVLSGKNYLSDSMETKLSESG